MPIAQDECDRKLLSDIATYGWHVPHIFADESGPEYSFSVGLYLKFGHPEILVMGLSQPVATQLINLAAGHIARGKVFQEGVLTEDLARGFACSFVSILIEHYQQYLGYDIWFYRSLKQPFPALQLVWPDKQGLLPWESNYDKRFNQLQRLLNVA